LSNYIPKITEIEEGRYLRIAEIVKNNPKVLSSADFIKLNRGVSYMTFIVKECWEYFSLKTSDGFYIFNLKKLIKEKEKLIQDAENVKNLINSGK
jgi:uncharacterized protein (UPF0128 family)